MAAFGLVIPKMFRIMDIMVVFFIVTILSKYGRTEEMSAMATLRNEGVVLVDSLPKFPDVCTVLGDDGDGNVTKYDRGDGNAHECKDVYNNQDVTHVVIIDPVQIMARRGLDLSVTTPEEEDHARNQFIPPELTLTCTSSDCGTLVKSTSRLPYSVDCTNCNRPEEIFYTWSVKSVINGVAEAVREQSGSCSNTLSCVRPIPVSTLTQSITYIVNVTAHRREKLQYWSLEEEFTVNTPPTSGTCVLSPDNGVALLDEFMISCEGWIDEAADFPGAEVGIFYEMRLFDYANEEHIIQIGDSGTSSPILVRPSLENKDHIVQIEIKIFDMLQECTNITLDFQVKAISDEEALRILSDIDKIYEIIQHEDVTLSLLAINLVSHFLSIEGLFDESEQLAVGQEVRFLLLNALENTTHAGLVTLDAVKLTTTVLESITTSNNPFELTPDSQVKGAELLGTMVTSLTDILGNSADTLDDDMTESIAKGLYMTSSNILEASLSSAGTTDQSGHVYGNASSQEEVAIRAILTVVDTLLDVAMTTLSPDNGTFTLESKVIEVQVSSVSATTLTGMAITSAHGGTTLPNIPLNSTNTSFGVKFVTYNKNPYIWNSPNLLENQPVVILEVEDEYGDDYVMDGLYTIKVNNSNVIEDTEQNATSAAETTLEMRHNMAAEFEVNVTTGNSTMVIEVHPESALTNYTLYINADTTPNITAEDYDDAWNITGNSTQAFTYNVVDIAKYSLLLTSAGDEVGLSNMVENVHVSVYFLICRYWEETSEEWMVDGCRAELSDINGPYVCKCNHLTGFTAAEFVVPVNKLEFTFDADIRDNAVVLIVILSFFGVYLVLLLLLRRKDKQDLVKWMILPLVDNKPEDTYLYKVTVYTGIKPFSGTESDVYFNVVGENGESGVRCLKDKKGIMDLKRSSVYSLTLALPGCLGELLYIHVWLKPKKRIFDAWYLERFHVSDLQVEGSNFDFVCYKWFAVDRDDAKVERLLPVSGDIQLASFDHLFSNNTRMKFTDDYLWGSLISRPTPSNFTRVERLSCCATYLYMAMIANAIFYQTPDSKGDTTRELKLGPLSFTLGTLYVSFISCLVTLPATLIIVEIFRKSNPIPDCSPGCCCCCCCRRRRKDSSQETLTDNDVNLDTKLKKSLPLPWWCKIIAWFLVFASMFLSSFFVVMYSLEWGKEVAHAWLTSEMTSFFLSSCVIDPLKAIGLAVVVSFLFMLIKKPLLSDDGEDNIRKYGATPESVKVTIKDGVQVSRRPPSETEVKVAHNRQTKRNRLKTTFREFLFYILFMVFAGAIANTYRSYSFYYSNNAVINVFRSDTLTGCSDVPCYFEWLKDTVIPAINPEYYYNQQPLSEYDRKFPKLSTGVSYMIGPVILRQVRVKPDKCVVHQDMRSSIDFCIPPYTVNEEDEGAYNTSWRPYPETDDKSWMSDTYYERELDLSSLQSLYSSDTGSESDGDDLEMRQTPQSPWIHSVHYDRDVKYAPSFWSLSGKTYSGTGFVSVLGTNQQRASRIVDYLYDHKWIDRYTRAVFLEAAIYNPFLKIYSLITVLVEFSEIGDATPSWRVDTLAFLDLFNFNFSTFLSIAVHVIYLIMVFYILCGWVWKLCTKGRRAIHGIWNLMDFTLFIMAVCSVGLFFVRLGANKWAMQELLSNQASYGSVRYVIIIDDIFAHFMALVSFFCILSFIRLLTLYKRTRAFFVILRLAWDTFTSFFLLLLVVFFSFASLFYLFFTRNSNPYMNYFKTVQTLLAVLVGSLRDAGGSIFEASPDIAQVFMVFYIFFESWVLLMLLLSVLNMATADAKASDEINRQDDIVDIAHDWMKDSNIIEFLMGGNSSKEKLKTTDNIMPKRTVPSRPRKRRLFKKKSQVDPIGELEARIFIIEKKTNILIRENGGDEETEKE